MDRSPSGTSGDWRCRIQPTCCGEQVVVKSLTVTSPKVVHIQNCVTIALKSALAGFGVPVEVEARTVTVFGADTHMV